MDNLLVTTMPIKPQKNTNIGMCFAPLISEVVGKNLDAKVILSTNSLHSYEEKNDLTKVYTDTLKKLGIIYDELFIDEDNVETLLECVNKLINQGLIVERENAVLSCPCGKVDIVKDGIRSFDNGDLYYKKENDFFCKSCNSKCVEILRKDLYLYLDPNIDYKINIIPHFLEADFTHFYKTLPGSYLLISKNRETGYQVKFLNGNIYSIDIDLLWMNYVQCFAEENQILIASNHQLYEMFILNYINKMLGEKNLNFIATPYMNKTNKDIFCELSKYDDILYKKLALLYTLKWRKKNCDWDQTIFKGIAKLGGKNRQLLYNIITNEFNECTDDLNKYINELLTNHIIMQKNINTLKKK